MTQAPRTVLDLLAEALDGRVLTGEFVKRDGSRSTEYVDHSELDGLLRNHAAELIAAAKALDLIVHAKSFVSLDGHAVTGDEARDRAIARAEEDLAPLLADVLEGEA